MRARPSLTHRGAGLPVKVDVTLIGAEIIDFADVEEVTVAEVNLVRRTLSMCDHLQVDEALN